MHAMCYIMFQSINTTPRELSSDSNTVAYLRTKCTIEHCDTRKSIELNEIIEDDMRTEKRPSYHEQKKNRKK